jgi:hypothetical protein
MKLTAKQLKQFINESLPPEWARHEEFSLDGFVSDYVESFNDAFGDDVAVDDELGSMSPREIANYIHEDPGFFETLVKVVEKKLNVK